MSRALPSGRCACADIAGLCDDLARQVERLSVSRRDPEAFFVERSEIAAALRGLGRVLPSRRDAMPPQPENPLDGKFLKCTGDHLR